MTAVLAARQHWCLPGERILWLREHNGMHTKYDVDGLDEKGNPKRGVMSRALRATALGVVGVAAAIDLAVDDDNYADGVETRSTPVRMWVIGGGPDCLAAQAARPWTHRDLPGWQWLPAWWVLTPGRFAFLTTTEAVAALRKGEKSLVGNVVKLAGEVAVSLATMAAAEYPAGKPVELPEVVSGFEFDRAQIASIGPTMRQESRKEQVPVLRVSLVDGSGFDLEVRGDLLRFTNGG